LLDGAFMFFVQVAILNGGVDVLMIMTRAVLV
jgi:hypothetical protein